jgi:mannose-6-phosphate isomerase-like protein (cupin superfamily)
MTIWKLAGGIGLALALAIGGVAAAQTASKPIYVPAKALDAMVAKTKDGLAAAKVPTGSPDQVVVIAHRTADGEVELHAKLADEIIVRSGRAKIRVGGKVTGQRQTAPNEFRGGTIAGGQVFDLAPGDAIWIPVGQPHQVLVPKGGQITYTAAKFPG